MWKLSKEGEPSWSTQVGDGRPGWHIEDTAISEYYFGPQYEIHGGGIDLKFPHHEAEIAQQEAASDKKPFVQFWMHAGALLVEGKKTSKSAGNFITIRDFLVSHSPETLRWITLTHHYRSPIDYSHGMAQQAAVAMDTLSMFSVKLDRTDGKETVDAKRVVAENAKKFNEALADDINTPLAIAVLFELTARFQAKIWTIKRSDAKLIKNHLKDSLDLLGISLKNLKSPPKSRK